MPIRRDKFLIAGSIALLGGVEGLNLFLNAQINQGDTTDQLGGTLPVKVGVREHTADIAQLVDPTQKAAVDQLYDDVVNAVYQDRSRAKASVMLSIAYGASQQKENQIHRPEVCYPAQGFQILAQRTTELMLAQGFKVPVRQCVFLRGGRREQVLYFIRIGSRISAGWFSQKIAMTESRLRLKKVDGLLFRVSVISNDDTVGFDELGRFVIDYANQLNRQAKTVIFGSQ